MNTNGNDNERNESKPESSLKMKQLIEYLESLKAGKISNTAQLEALLSVCWHEFKNSDEESMEGYKLHKRMKEVTWEPPILTFVLERHGATVCGSSRAGLHTWVVDFATCTAGCSTGRFKQLTPMKPKLNTKKLAEDIVQLILNHEADERLKWNDDGSVRVLTGNIIPSGSAIKQTLEGRRKRFHDDLTNALQSVGWQKVRINVYSKQVHP